MLYVAANPELAAALAPTEVYDMPNIISYSQVRGARAVLGWSLIDMSEAAHVSVSVAHKMESEHPQTVPDFNRVSIRRALELAGAVFQANVGEGAGMKMRHL